MTKHQTELSRIEELDYLIASAELTDEQNARGETIPVTRTIRRDNLAKWQEELKFLLED